MRPFFCIVPNSKNFMFMKKISFLTLAALTSLTVLAQNTDDKAHKPIRTEMSTETRFGIKGGVNLATLEVDDDFAGLEDFETNNKTSFHGGIFVNIPLGDVLRFQPELVYSGQGSKVAGTVLGTEYRDEWDMHYLSIPLMFQVQSSGGFFAEAGPHVNFLLSAKDEEENDLKDELDLKTLDYGVGVGIGYLSRIGLGINGRYNFGFANIYDQDDNFKVKNRTINLGLVYHFGAHK